VDEKQFLCLLDELLEVERGTTTRESRIESIGWSSLAAIGFIALVHEHFNLAVSPRAIAKCDSVDDLIELLGGAIVVPN
jgi:acyl carrier protein